jgi:hypothetical protein
MSKGKNKRRRMSAAQPRLASTPPARSSTTRTGSSSKAGSAAGGLLGRILGPPVPPALSVMPTFRTSLGQGFLLVASNPVLLFGPIVFVFLAWLLLLALGFVGSGIGLSQMAAMPPISTAFDTQNAIAIAGQSSGLIVALPLLLFRGLLVAVLSGLIVEGFERQGSVSRYGALRGLVAFPLVLAMLMLSFVGLFLAQFGSVFGPGIGTLLQVLLPAFVLYALGFVPFSAVRERDSLAQTLRRAYAGARTPGGRHLSFCILYVLLAFVLPLFVPGRSVITANLRAGTWIGLFVLTYVHLGFTAAMAYRWLGIESTAQASAPRR